MTRPRPRRRTRPSRSEDAADAANVVALPRSSAPRHHPAVRGMLLAVEATSPGPMTLKTGWSHEGERWQKGHGLKWVEPWFSSSIVVHAPRDTPAGPSETNRRERLWAMRKPSNRRNPHALLEAPKRRLWIRRYEVACAIGCQSVPRHHHLADTSRQQS